MPLEDLRNSADEASSLLKLVSGRHRLTLLVALLDGEMSVGRLAENVKKSDTAVSQQLAVLRGAGFVSKRRDGQLRFYSISNPAAKHLVEAALAMQRERAEAGTPTLAE
jgi:DNA-binding transcriptional ArsR family regulator